MGLDIEAVGHLELKLEKKAWAADMNLQHIGGS